MIADEKLDFWLENNFNVLFTGRHGTGKTSMVSACAERNGLELGRNFLYYSASTLDPWVDIVGVPKEKTDEDGVSYLELVRPKQLASGEVEFIFMDEYNRSHSKVRNAIMELIQFKSINGKGFPNLRCVWAAINPDDDEDADYNVERLDPAQKDRFHINVEVPYLPSLDWFTKRFGEKIANGAVSWWGELPDQEKKLVSPRRLEYALNVWELGGSPRDVLPSSTNITKLLQTLEHGPISDRLKELLISRDGVSATSFLEDENNYASAVAHITKNNQAMDFFLNLLNKEKLAVLLSTNAKARKFMCVNRLKHSNFQATIDDVVNASLNRRLINSINKLLITHPAKSPGAYAVSGGEKSVVSPATNSWPTSSTPSVVKSRVGSIPDQINQCVIKSGDMGTTPSLIEAETGIASSRIKQHLKFHRDNNGTFVEENGYWKLAPNLRKLIKNTNILGGASDAAATATEPTINP